MPANSMLPVSWLHRQIRDYALGQDKIPLSAEYSDLDWYLIYQMHTIEFIGEHFNDGFPEDYRRKSGQFEIEVSTDGEIEVYIDTKNVLHITAGLFMAIEDASQSIYSDKLVPLGGSIGETPEDRWIIQRTEHLSTDPLRYFDYSQIIHTLYAHGITDIDFVGFLYRFVSCSEQRRLMADLSANMSLEWIFSHEDAHLYLGHVAFSRKHFDAAAFYQEFHVNNQINPFHNIYCEYDADRNAIWRMVDNYHHNDTFEAYDFLSVTLEHLNFKSGGKLHLSTLRGALVANLILTSVSINLIIFQRTVMKYSATSEKHPPILFRFLNVVMETFHRMFSKIISSGSPSEIVNFIDLTIATTLALFKDQFMMVRYYLVDGSIVNHDQESNFFREEFKSLTCFFDDDFYVYLSIYCKMLFGNGFLDDKNKIPFHVIDERYQQLFSDFTDQWIDYISYANEIVKFRLMENPEIRQKILESMVQNESFIEKLNTNIIR